MRAEFMLSILVAHYNKPRGVWRRCDPELSQIKACITALEQYIKHGRFSDETAIDGAMAPMITNQIIRRKYHV